MDASTSGDSAKMPGLRKLLSGVLKYRQSVRPRMLEQFQRVKDNPEPKAVMFSCMDSRILITRLLQCDVGDMFLVRNAGNLVPHANLFSFHSVSTEPGALELGCITNNIEHVIVCGHSDCKAMNLLYTIRDSVKVEDGTPLQMWLKRHGAATVAKFEKLQQIGGSGPLDFQAETPDKVFQAYIDPENKFSVVDKFSQVNVLMQLQNIASHGILQDKLKSGCVKIHAMWFDIYNADFYIFSKQQKAFVEIDDKTYNSIISEIPE